MTVELPDGSIQQIRYVGDTPPQIRFVAQPVAAAPIAEPTDIFEAAFGPNSAFAEMERVSAAMQAQSAAMMQRAMAQAPAASGKGVTLTNAAGQPIGVMHYSYVSSSTDANGCTQTVSYNSDDQAPNGQPAQPKLTRIAYDGCGVAARAGVTPTVAPAPATNPAPVVTPTSAPKPVPKAVPTTTI